MNEQTQIKAQKHAHTNGKYQHLNHIQMVTCQYLNHIHTLTYAPTDNNVRK